MSNSKFKIQKVTKFADLLTGDVKELPTSDLCITNDEVIAQFEYVEGEENADKTTVKPGVFTLTKSPVGITLVKTELQVAHLLETIDNTSKIKKEVNVFFSKLDIYEQLQLVKKRAVLLYGVPGTGKTQTIKRVVLDMVKEEPGTVVMIWPTSEIHAETVARFIGFGTEFTSECTRLLLIIEDIGGTEEESGRIREVSSGLLNLLDGVNINYKLPTFMIATTNHPEKLLSSLADRPGRFDQLMELPPPGLNERIELLEFISKRLLTVDERNALDLEGAELLSIAHLKEIVTRTLLHDKTVREVVKEMIEHTKKFNRGFEKPQRRMGFYDDEE